MPRRFFLLLILLVGASPAAAFAQPVDLGWTEFRNERFGLALRYPADVFVSQRSANSGDGDLFETPDRHGRLLVGAIENTERFTPRSYQSFIAEILSGTSHRLRSDRPELGGLVRHRWADDGL